MIVTALYSRYAVSREQVSRTRLALGTVVPKPRYTWWALHAKAIDGGREPAARTLRAYAC